MTEHQPQTAAAADVSWSGLSRWRRECGQRFGEFRDVPQRTPHEVVAEAVCPGCAVLDVGAGVDHAMRPLVEGGGGRYYSLDVDPAGSFDFRSAGEIPEGLQFDLMVSNQVLEHLEIGEALGMLQSLRGALKPEGRLMANVPNVYHPVRYWGDATHVTPWPLGDLYGLFRCAGFEVVQMYRYGKRDLPRNPLKRWVVRVVSESYRIDWCDSLMAVVRPEPSA